MTNCGRLGWVTDHTDYRYSEYDPEAGQLWPTMPDCLLELTTGAAREAGYPGFAADACLVNRCLPGSRMPLHQNKNKNKNEEDYSAPIMSVSLWGCQWPFSLAVWPANRAPDAWLMLPPSIGI